MLAPLFLMSHVALAAAPIAHLGEVTAKLKLTPAEVAQVTERRMIVLEAESNTYIGTYRRIYKNDLPLVVTADSLLYPLHDLLRTQVVGDEGELLLSDLVAALGAMERGLGRVTGPEPVARDVDLYLCVATALATQPDEQTLAAHCRDASIAPFAEQLLAKLRDGWLDDREIWTGGSAQPAFQVSLQGGLRELNPGDFVPNLPYTSPESQRWFRAVTWLREGGFLLSQVTPKGQVANRRAALGAAWLTWLAQVPDAGQRWRRIHTWLESIYGPPDEADLEDMATWMAGRRPADLVTAEGWEHSLAASGLGQGSALGGVARFSLVGPSFALDTLALTGLAPVGERPTTAGLLAAMGNADALAWVPASQRGRAADLAARLDALPDSTWGGSVRARWLGAIRALGRERMGPLPAPWGLDVGAARVGMVQLLAWTWLRHDTRLFAPAGREGGCSFPEVIVEPFPAFYEGLAGTAGAIRDALAAAGRTDLSSHLDGYEATLLHLRDIAAQERALSAVSEKDRRWLKGALSFRPINEYDGDAIDGWYPHLYWDLSRDTLGEAITNWERVVTDAFVRPATADFQGEILHVGTGSLRMMVVVADTCDGPVAAVGPTQDVHEIWTPGTQALSDSTWVSWLEGYGEDKPSEDEGWIPPRAEWLGPIYGPVRPGRRFGE